MAGPESPLLVLENLTVGFETDDGLVQAVRGVDLDVGEGDVLAVVGESGSGKSVTALSVLGLHPAGRTRLGGRVLWRGEDLLTANDERMRQVRGGEISMVFQDPLTALNPVYSVGDQIIEMVRSHESVSRSEARTRAIEMLQLVGIPQPDKRVDSYPHEFSGGMRQRAMIAMALSCEPKLVIADEPTTALDVTVQAQVLEVLLEASRRRGAAIMLITHDLGVVASMADKVAVMYAGKVVERAETDELFARPTHPYTIGLLGSLPRVDAREGDTLTPIGGQPPSMLTPPSGCAFHPRCSIARRSTGCADVMPELTELAPAGSSGGGHGGVDGAGEADAAAAMGSHQVACHRRDEAAVMIERGER